MLANKLDVSVISLSEENGPVESNEIEVVEEANMEEESDEGVLVPPDLLDDSLEQAGAPLELLARDPGRGSWESAEELAPLLASEALNLTAVPSQTPMLH